MGRGARFGESPAFGPPVPRAERSGWTARSTVHESPWQEPTAGLAGRARPGPSDGVALEVVGEKTYDPHAVYGEH